MEVRVVKFNLKVFIEDFIFAKESKDKVARESLEEVFRKEYENSSQIVREGMEKFITTSKIASESKDLQKLIKSCVRNFRK